MRNSKRFQTTRARGRKLRARNTADEIFERALRDEVASTGDRFRPREDRKTMQLCRQVERALMLALAGPCADDILRDVQIDSVRPMGGASQLLVQVIVPAGANVSAAQVLLRLNERAGMLRTIVAQSICRKRAPGLSFLAVPAEGGFHE